MLFVKIGVILLVILLALLFIGTAIIGIYVGVINPIQNGHYPLYQAAQSFGINEKANFICFIIVLVPFLFIAIGLSSPHHNGKEEQK